jgi:glucose/mannose-6-phosphate isomerase
MSILDQPDQWKSIDPGSMRSLIQEFPSHIEAAAEAGRKFSLSKPAAPSAIVVTGLGGSAIGGDLAKAIAGPRLNIPFIVSRDYSLPAFINSSTVVFACSYSGNTEETISAYEQARNAGASIICITSGGRIEEMGNADGYPVLKMPQGFPPRAALGYSLVTLLAALHAAGLSPDMKNDIDEAIELLKKLRGAYAPENPESLNPAKKIAASLKNKIVAIYGSSGVMEATAFRWRSQFEENAKNLAFHHVLPEMNHNELVGWLRPEEALKNVGVVFLRDKGDHPQVQQRFELVKKIIASKAGSLNEVWSEGESLAARILSMIFLGDYVSLYLAYLNQEDPMPVAVIDYLKKSLASAK